ncbi:MAG: protein kinase domain-containing protein [Candidatus Longimicrobiales bacterium M2_2A_002]
MNETIDRLNAALEGRYHIDSEVGAGGMATVYLAQDLKHERQVALKVLKPELAAVVGGERFLSEIKTTANLAHPNILPLFDSGEADSFLYYVMPYVEGESLRDRLDREKQMGVEDAVRLAREVAEALDHAHRQGVVHRDVKPANILLQDGRPLVSDFGIALAVSQAGGGRLTETGLSMGTPHYMSPEQASGDRDVDPRTDVYSLGCVLFEMLTGEPPYGGGTAQAVLARILTGSPDRPTAIRGTIPRHVEAVILKAMEKLPADRFESTADFAKALQDPSFRHGEEAETAGASAGRWRVVALAAAGLAVVALGGWLWGATRSSERPPTMRSVFALLSGQEILDRLYKIASFAPDGSFLIYHGPGADGPQLWIKDRDQARARPLAGTTGAQHPEVDPSGRWVAFTTGQELRKLPLSGGPSVVLADSATADIGSIAWLDDGHIVYSSAPNFRPRRVPAEGGRSEAIAVELEDSVSGGSIAYAALPGGSFLFTYCVNFCQAESIVKAWSAATGETTTLVPGALAGWYVDSGHLVFVRPNGDVFAVEFDPRSMELGGEPVPLFEGAQVDNGVIPDMEAGPSGQLLVRMGGSGNQTQSFAWLDREGRRTVVDPDFTYQLQIFAGWRLSPDDRFVAFARTTEAGSDIWIKELDEGPVYRLTFDDAAEYRPAWSPDGEHVMFVSERGDNRDLYRRRANATGPEELVLDRPREISQGTWSHDGEWLVYREGTGQGRDIWALRPDQDTAASALVADRGYDEKAPALSPDDRWLAYESDETGQEEVYVRPFPGVEDGKWQISVSGGVEPVWGHSGREIFYIRGDGMLMAAEVDPGPPFRVGTRTELFSVADIRVSSTDHASYDVTRDDQRFLFSVPEGLETGEDTYWLMVENWTTELADLRGER